LVLKQNFFQEEIKQMKKKGFYAVFGALIVPALLLLTVCAGGGTVKSGNSGSATASAQGYGGTVTVTVTLDNGRISAVSAEGPNETQGIGSRAVERLPQAMEEKGSPDVEAISGASITSAALISAARAAIAEINGDGALSAVMKSGTYTASSTGFALYKEITVNVRVDRERILAITVEPDHGETVPILQSVIDKFIPRIIETQSIGIDALTGATASSNGIRRAVSIALTEALIASGSDAAAIAVFQKIPPGPARVRTETINTRVLVVGMGGAGTAAAMRAAETLYAANPQDVSVLAIDKAGKYGGTSAVTSEMMAINPRRFQAEYNNGRNYVDRDAMRRAWLAYTEGDQKTELVDLMLNNSGDALDWLMYEHGVTFTIPHTGFTPADVYQSVFAYAVQDHPELNTDKTLIGAYYDSIYRDYTRLGGRYLLETEAYALIYDASGNTVKGVKARNVYDGTEYEIYADSIILATGGFAGNTAMEERYFHNRYFPLKGPWMQLGMHQNDGKMIQNAIDNGAGTYNISVAPIVHMAGTPSFLTGFGVYPIEGAIGYITRKPAVWSPGDIPMHMVQVPNSLAVNQEGVRFTSETDVGFLNPWIAGPRFFSIHSNDQVQSIREHGFKIMAEGPGPEFLGYQHGAPAGIPQPEIERVLQAGIDAGFVYKANTLRELAALIGVPAPALENTVREYNQAAANGVDRAFNKPAEFLDPIGNGPYYAITGASYCYSTTGALDINADFQVLKADGRTPINHLYAIGTDSLGVLFTEKKAYVTYGGAAQGWAYTSGYLGGKAAAEAALAGR
jgi:fumarate reductase flavoprotein subunit